MSSSPPRIIGFATDQGTPGSVVRTSIIGTGLETVTAVHLSGSGVSARILRPPRRDRIDVAISIAADAAPGPRAVRLSPARAGPKDREPVGVLFYVIAPTSYGTISGIGSHLL
jgi:hypothetical protein